MLYGENTKKQYPLIGISIIVIAALILASLSNVVGYQSVQSTITNNSPLFTLRTKRATNQTREDILTTHFLKKGIDSNIHFTTRDNKIELLKIIFETIKKMDDATFQKFLFLLQQHLKASITLNKQQLLELNKVFTEIRKQENLPIVPRSQMYSMGCPPSIFDEDNIYCKLYYIIIFFSYLFLFIVVIYHIIHFLLPGILPFTC